MFNPEGIRYDKLPGHERMRPGVRRWIEDGIRPGRFLRAVIANDLLDAFAQADDDNVVLMRDWARWFYNEAPGGCWGSPEKAKAWKEAGGLNGMRENPKVA